MNSNKPVFMFSTGQKSNFNGDSVFNSIRTRAFYYGLANDSHRKFSSFQGETKSEKNIINLVKKTNLNYWTISNPYGYRGYEMCDALVIFNNNIIIISDKEKDDDNIDSKIELGKKWKNFYKSIKKSEDQLTIAKNWILNNPGEIYYDKLATQKLEVNIDFTKVKFHLISTISNWTDIGKEYLNNRGNLLINTDDKIQGKNRVLTTYNREKDGSFLHMFDEESFKMILDELDTSTDFIDYLNERELFFVKNKKKGIVIKSETELSLLGTYIKSKCIGVKKNVFDNIGLNSNNILEFDSGIYEKIKTTDSEKLFDSQKADSLVIDDLITNLSYVGDIEHSGIKVDYKPEDCDYRSGLEILAELSRAERIQLQQMLLDLFNSNKKVTHDISKVAFIENENGANLFVIVIKYINEEINVKQFKKDRALQLKQEFTDIIDNYNIIGINNVIGLGFDNPYGFISESEDLIGISFR
jgi:hypothetical protein